MAQIQVTDLTFSYEGSADEIFQNATFRIDTDWKLGLVGRNGKGKTTLLHLLMGKYDYQGSITSGTRFDYFPYSATYDFSATDCSDGCSIASEKSDDVPDFRPNGYLYGYSIASKKTAAVDFSKTGLELMEVWKPQAELWQVLIQMNQLKMDPECLYRPFVTLSWGERTRVMLAVLFSSENEFLLIDEPTNHLDVRAREIVKNYLAAKRGFILVSHDRDLLDGVCDHMLVLNRETIEVQAGNFSSWWENKEKQDAFRQSENEKHLREIGKLRAAADRSGRWADKSESTKIGYDPVKEHDRGSGARAYIGAKTKKMQSRVKSYETRIMREIEEKEGLLKDIERVADLKLRPLSFHKEVLIDACDLALQYEGSDRKLFEGLRFQVKRGDRVLLSGENGCGKSSILRAILQKAKQPYCEDGEKLRITGRLDVASGLIISYVSQDTSSLSGSLADFAKRRYLDETLFLAVLRQLDLGRAQFSKKLEEFSEGQKKKVLLAASLITPAHLYIWDEPLNYIDVFSRMQIEKLILQYEPTMLLVEHDVRFQEKAATDIVRI